MSGLPWYPRWIGDYAENTQDLSMLEHGAYTLMLDYYYANGPLPVDNSVDNSHRSSANADLFADSLTTRVMRICRAVTREEQTAVNVVLKRFFRLRDGHFHQKRADEEIEKRNKISPVRSEAGKVGAAKTNQKRWGKDKHKLSANADKFADVLPTVLPSTPTSRSLTPQPPRGGRVLNSGWKGIESYLRDDDRAEARRKAPQWDLQVLMREYDAQVENGSRPPPNAPARAFIGWAAKRTGGKPP